MNMYILPDNKDKLKSITKIKSKFLFKTCVADQGAGPASENAS